MQKLNLIANIHGTLIITTLYKLLRVKMHVYIDVKTYALCRKIVIKQNILKHGIYTATMEHILTTHLEALKHCEPMTRFVNLSNVKHIDPTRKMF